MSPTCTNCERLREALQEYGEHFDQCPAGYVTREDIEAGRKRRGECSCGLDAAQPPAQPEPVKCPPHELDCAARFSTESECDCKGSHKLGTNSEPPK